MVLGGLWRTLRSLERDVESHRTIWPEGETGLLRGGGQQLNQLRRKA